MHIYAFGSICRGEISPTSDIDLLAIVSEHDARFDPQLYSIYSYSRLAEIWAEGNPFAWHLHLESSLIYTPNGKDFLRDLGQPSKYTKCREDCIRFADLFNSAIDSLKAGRSTAVFDLSTAFLGIRNFASCFSLGVLGKPNFSRHSAVRIGEHSVQISPEVYSVLERSRILSTRALGNTISSNEVIIAVDAMTEVRDWMKNILSMVECHERV